MQEEKMLKHGLEPVLLGQQSHTPSCLFEEPEYMEPTIQQWIFMRDHEGLPMCSRADGSTRRTSPYKVELQHRDDDQPHPDSLDIEE
eukprot:5114798-Prorocentrum_lima.AAC.1